MTPNMKIKHAVEVLKIIEGRVRNIDEEDPTAVATNILDLIKLLEKPHKTEKQQEINSDTWFSASELSDRLLVKIVKRKPNLRSPDRLGWIAEMDKILRLDKRTPEQLEELIDWCQQDEFWQDNILSPAKLRKQLDKLEMKMAKDKQWQRNRRLHRPVEGKTAKDEYLESLENQNVNENS